MPFAVGEFCFSRTFFRDKLAQTMVAAQPPGPALQKLNAALHKEPIASIAYCYFWSLFLIIWIPIAVVVLQIRTAFKLLAALDFTVFFRRCSNAYDPEHNQKLDMAVCITGCDSGFGREMAMWAADAGYTVFAGCLDVKHLDDGILPDKLIALQMDVTSDKQVDEAVRKVQAWLKEGGTDNNNKQRVLHALICNAGVGVAGLVDWTKITDFQFCMDGTYIRCR